MAAVLPRSAAAGDASAGRRGAGGIMLANNPWDNAAIAREAGATVVDMALTP